MGFDFGQLLRSAGSALSGIFGGGNQGGGYTPTTTGSGTAGASIGNFRNTGYSPIIGNPRQSYSTLPGGNTGYTPQITNPSIPYSSWNRFNNAAPSASTPSSSGGGMMGALGGLFKNKAVQGALPGLGVMGMGAMIPNSKMPDMPQEFTNYMGQLNAGGTPGMQAADKYYQGVLSGQNKDAYDAAFNSLDLNYQEQLRQLNSMYKSLRPGTDPTSDSTYQRDLAQLNDQYARQRAQVGAQVQQGAASGAVGLGSNLAQMQGGAVQQYLDRIATQWGMNQSQRQALRETIMGLGGKMITGPMDIGNLIAQSKAMKAAMGG